MISFPSLVNIAEWRSGLSRLPHKQEIVGSNPTSATSRSSSILVCGPKLNTNIL